MQRSSQSVSQSVSAVRKSSCLAGGHRPRSSLWSSLGTWVCHTLIALPKPTDRASPTTPILLHSRLATLTVRNVTGSGD